MITTHRRQVPAAKHPIAHAPPRPAPSTAGTATDAPPGERVTPSPTKVKPAAAKAAAPAAEGTAAGTAKKSAPGFTAVFAAAGVLAAEGMILHNNKKTSLAKSAEIAGLTTIEFKEILADRG